MSRPSGVARKSSIRRSRTWNWDSTALKRWRSCPVRALRSAMACCGGFARGQTSFSVLNGDGCLVLVCCPPFGGRQTGSV